MSLGGIFIGPYGLRSGWRLFCFAILYLLLAVATGLMLKSVHGELKMGLAELASLASVIMAMMVMARVERKPFRSFGLARIHAARNFSIGLATGFVSLSVLIASLIALRVYRVDLPAQSLSHLLLWCAITLLFFLMVACNEELVTRSYALFALSQGIGFWPAAILMSFLFGAGHLANGGEDYVGVSAALLIGIVLAWSLRRSGSLWWAIGYHFAWDWAETFFYGVPDSGIPSAHHFLSAGVSGPRWLSGGPVGPEGSVLVIPVIGLLALVVRYALVPVRIDGLERLRRADAVSQQQSAARVTGDDAVQSRRGASSDTA